MPALVQNPSPGTGQQAQLASWLRQATGGITPTQHADPPAAPWYQGQMDQRQAAQAEMVREWKVEQERKAAEAAAAQAAYDLAHPEGDGSGKEWLNRATNFTDKWGAPGLYGPGTKRIFRKLGK